MPDTMTATPETIGERLTRLRKARGLSLRGLADFAGINHSMVSRAEADKTVPDDETAEKLAAGLGVTKEDILRGGPASEIEPLGLVDEPDILDDNTEPAPDTGRIPYSLIDPSPLNHRRIFDEAALERLEASIAKLGIIQNLILRPSPASPGRFEIGAGERRWRAVGNLIAKGEASADYPMPAIVRVLSDVEMIEIGLSENIDRETIHPLEEAEAFADIARLSEFGDGATSRIAQRFNRTPRWVQQRIALAQGLSPAAKAAFLSGRLYLEQARMMTLGAFDRQDALLQQAGNGTDEPGPLGWTPAAIRDQILGPHPAVGVNEFPLEAYAGPFIEPEDSGLANRLFGDVVLFARLQEGAIEATRARLADAWAWAEIQRGAVFDPGRYGESGDPAIAGAVVFVHPNWTVAVHAGLVRPEDKKKLRQAERKAAETPPLLRKMGDEPAAIDLKVTYTAQHLVEAHKRKTGALQDRVARKPVTAMRLVCLALLGSSQAVRIQPATIAGEDRTIGKATMDTLATFVGQLPVDPTQPLGREVAGVAATALWDALAAMPTEPLMNLFSGLVASLVGTFTDGHPEIGDREPVCHVAASLDVDSADDNLGSLTDGEGAAWLKHYRKPALIEVITESKSNGTLKSELARVGLGLDELREMILSSPTRRDDYIPRELRFGPTELLMSIGGALPEKPGADAEDGDGLGR